MTEKFGRFHHHVNYKPFNNNKIILKENVSYAYENTDYGMRLVKLV